MRTLETVYKVELTNAEVKTLVLALQNEFTAIRERIAAAEKEVEAPENDMNIDDMHRMKSSIRSLRNGFGSLVGISYMGMDA